MTPVQQAASVYRSEVCPRSFREDLELHLLNGYVFSTPDYFVMGRAVDLLASYALITNPAHVFPMERRNAWLVYLMAGDMAKATAQFPCPLPYVGFERKNKLRFYGFEFLVSRISTSRRRGAVCPKGHLQDFPSCDTLNSPLVPTSPPT